MVVLGLLLIILAVVFGADIVLENTASAVGKMFHQSVTNLSLGGIFLAGAVTALVLALGLWLVFGGAARKRRKRVQRKSALRETQVEKETLAEENARLARQLEQERAAKASAAVSPYDDTERGRDTDDRETRVVRDTGRDGGVIRDGGSGSGRDGGSVRHPLRD